MPLKPPSSAMTRIMRIIVPIDMCPPQPLKGACPPVQPRKPAGTMKVPALASRYSAPPSLRASRNYIRRINSWLSKRIVMSAPLVVSIPHRLGREEAVRRLKGGLGRAAASVPVLHVDEERWEGDQMFFRVRALGQVASGNVQVAEDHVRLEVMLPLLLQRFGELA